ncbi:YceK/YidQ family lipoprotein [Leptospira santarosai]|nr:YceK/YidQ family lipoprotein [Leptospira santarosai]MDI7188292.1 YceK/YidQ family lipoprotein [Leptospira santarosai]MDI7211009.1 YceK/YidQ family lipoprotein [Leptospira santarosai]MDI7219812.1 YceK/YidQ family lipoprotein [Leptospira santarosai]
MLIDLPFTFVLDTVLLPISFPYYVYVESGRPWSEEWYYKKWKKRLYTFMAKNSSSDILSLSLAVAKTDYPLYGNLLKAVLYLEKKILRLQQDGFTLNKDLEYLMSVSSNGTMGAESQLKQHIEIVSIAYEQLREYPELKDSYNEKFWKKYFEIVWRNYFSKGTLIHPDVFKKILHEFSDRKDAEILFKEIAFFYSKEEYALQTSYSLYFNNLDEDLSLSGFSPESRSILGLPTTNREFWKNRIQILMELDRMVRKEFPNLKKSFDPVWTEAISSGVVSYDHPALEKAFQEFPKETKTSVGNLFKKVVDSNNPYSIEVIGKYVSDLNAFFASDQEMIRTVLRSPNILEKLLQAGLDPNLTYGIEDTFLILCLEDNEETSVNSLRLLLKYGAETNLPVGRYSRGKEYLHNSNADPDFTPSGSFLKKRKILTEWMKKQP